MREADYALGSRIDQTKTIRLVPLVPAATFLGFDREMAFPKHMPSALT